MARIRTIKPEFWSSEQVMECSTNARLLFIGMWNFCDDKGRHPSSPKQLKALVFPGDDLSVEKVRGMVDELSRSGLITRYVVENREYFEVTGWHHQKIDKPQDPKFPGPFDDPSETDPGRVAADRIGREKRREDANASLSETRISDDQIPKAAKTRNSYQADFLEFWSAYPTDANMSKAEASKAWARLTPEDRRSATASVPNFREYCRKSPDYRPVHAVRFLTHRRFEGHAPKPNGSAGNGSHEPGPHELIVDFRNGYTAPHQSIRDTVKRGYWPDQWGPKRGERGCFVSEELWLQWDAEDAKTSDHPESETRRVS